MSVLFDEACTLFLLEPGVVIVENTVIDIIRVDRIFPARRIDIFLRVVPGRSSLQGLLKPEDTWVADGKLEDYKGFCVQALF